ncbi:transmembrane glyco protein [Aspergillus heteromorphus CBS 117.55]|uniref:Transmembrane glyco protein n=1 Tax=Aspergillus heteromorphus CBS 117.55 TaxID=1448321 RepID=A0A317W5G7_9EURO|nr:transmembrane glyco protein [Aspergillus heteromorphus CBS 117.55]PWY81814.1 transmembrane glyco protein [Aspergillus heteromorphus CBS 117.55]
MAHIALALLSILVTVNAALEVSYPINAQLPPVARVSQPFEFVFSQGTFSGSNPDTQYSLSDAPSWLKLDSHSRTLSGTPQKEDQGSPKFNLAASDGSGSVSMEVTLVVTTDDGPKPGRPLLPQLENMGATSAPDTIFIHSGDSFSLSFEPETFTNTRPSTVYYGTSPDNAPLPSWVGFDQASLKFSGATPASGPQTFSFNLVASDVAGFSAAIMTFEMTVSPHILAFNRSTQTFFPSRGKQFTSPQFASNLTLDGHDITKDDLKDVHVDSPSWLSLDKETISLSGTPPADATDQNVTISVTDGFHDVATLIVSLQFSQFFHNNPDECDATIGKYFTFIFDDAVLTNDSVQLDVDMGQDLSWLHYNRDNKTLYGQVPSDIDPGSFHINLTAREETAEDTRQFTINAVSEEDTDDAQGPVDNPDPGHSSSSHAGKAGIIAIAVVVPFVFLSTVILLFCCWRHKRKAAATSPEDGESSEKRLSLQPDGGGFTHCQRFEDTTQGEPPEMFRSPSPSSKPPKLELPSWSASPLGDTGHLRDAADKENTFPGSTIEWDFAPLRGGEPEPEEIKPVEEAPAQPKRLSFQNSPPLRRKTTTNSRKREPLRSIQPRRSLKRNSTASRSRRYSKRSSGISTVASGLPVRLSGAGHGAGVFGPPGHGVVRMSWQNTQAGFQSDDSDVENLAPLFPRPPPRTRESAEYPKRMSLRTVEPDALTISEADSLEAFVHSRAKSRNSSNPLFAGQFSRRASSGGRALERARSTVSRADTLASSNYVDDYRHSIQDRPWSTAMSASIYTDDNRQSAYLHCLSEESFDTPMPGSVRKLPSQSSLAQNYSDAIAPLPRPYSELSLNSTRRFYGGGAFGKENDPPYEQHTGGGTRPWLQATSYSHGDMPGTGPPLRHSPSLFSIPHDNRPRRVSLTRVAEQDWDEPQAMAIPRDLTGSVRSDTAAFV